MRTLSLALLLVSATASAQTRTDVRAGITSDGTTVRVTSTWGKHSDAKLQLGDGKAVSLAKGGSAAGIATGHGKTIVALAIDDPMDPFEIVAIDGTKVSKPVTISRPTDRYDMPFAVAITPTPDGFIALFQEVQTDDATAAHTYLVALDDNGSPQGAAKEVAIPWALGDIAWNGTGLHLALYYNDGRGVRLSMVTATKDGQPQGHPDWASKSGLVSDAHLVASDGKVRAFYRNGEHLMEADVTKVGSWGQEPAAAKDRGALAWSQAIAVNGKGEPTKVKR